MKIVSVRCLAFPEVKVIRFARFADHRGYFTEVYRQSDFKSHDSLSFLSAYDFVQVNESHSRAGTLRGLHFQWQPPQGKLVRTVNGRMIDLVMDVRRGSPTWGRILAYDMPAHPTDPFGEWIWVPPGFAHGNAFTADTTIQYQCTGEYNSQAEAGISPLATDIDWTQCDPALRATLLEIISAGSLISDKDQNGFNLATWYEDPRSRNFLFLE